MKAGAPWSCADGAWWVQPDSPTEQAASAAMPTASANRLIDHPPNGGTMVTRRMFPVGLVRSRSAGASVRHDAYIPIEERCAAYTAAALAERTLTLPPMTNDRRMAPGAPGIEPRWTSSAKTGVGTSLSGSSHVWFTLSHGIFNEIYFPDVDMPCTRDMGMIVTNGQEFFSEEKRHTVHEIAHIAPGVPAFRLRNTCEHGRYRLDKHIVSSVRHDTVLQQTNF